MKKVQFVQVWEEEVVIPTYKTGEPDKNPMFLEKRVYQGSSGRVYPHTVIDKIFDEKENKTYKAVYLENDFIKVMVLPEIGGKIHRATDKTNGYDFIYHNHVIKPALVGLTGPWVSGGIEFNWPQHHRPSTFDPVEYSFHENDDGSATIVVGEIENMFRTKGLINFTVYPDSTYIEVKAQLFNRTNLPQTFLWWANPAIAVNDNTRTIFPPDVTAVMDHGKRAVSRFPIATGTYYKVDYSAGVDISRYKNLPVPTSYMAAKSDYDFVGGYDDGVDAGILHVADHHVAPGKKQWTWGCGEFGKAWDRNLTDDDGPYIELMTGCFTDNQPDFSWIAPMEEKRFIQYFMPYKNLGTVHNATKDLALNFQNGCVNLYSTGNVGEITLAHYSGSNVVFDITLSMNATESFSLPVDDDNITKIVVLRNGMEYLAYTTDGKTQEIPDVAVCPPEPKDCETIEDLYLYGLHIEQYRHATYLPADYYLEGLKRDSSDVRLNNAYGLMLLRKGLFVESEKYFKNAIKKATRSNPNPYDSEPYYNLGLALLYQKKLEESYDAFYKSTWSGNNQSASFYHMACICSQRKDFDLSLSHLENSLMKNAHNFNAMNLKALVLNEIGCTELSTKLAKKVLSIDCMNIISQRMIGNKLPITHNTAIEIAIEYMVGGFYEQAIGILKANSNSYPMVFYYLSYCYKLMGNMQRAENSRCVAETSDSFGCFPHRLEDMIVLEDTLSSSDEDAMAHYYLGNLLYDKSRCNEAISHFEKCTRLAPNFPTAHRNLSLAYFNHLENHSRARLEMEIAFQLDKTDARVLMEVDQLYKKTGVEPKIRLAFFKEHVETVAKRDDLLIEYVTLLNLTGSFREAYKCISHHNFHPWEGGEGKVSAQYVFSLVAMAQQSIETNECETAINFLKRSFNYPENLGEGKLYGAHENLQYYLLGTSYEKLSNFEEAKKCYEIASMGDYEPQSAMYYNDQPPETIFCQGMAFWKLGRKKDATKCFEKLIDYADAHYNDNVKIDYFAVSLPDFLVFNEDLNKKNKVHCLFMKSLGLLGKGVKSEALVCAKSIEVLDCNHFGISSYKTLFFN